MSALQEEAGKAIDKVKVEGDAWWDSLSILRMMKVGDIAELSDGTYGRVEKFAQGVFYAWVETEPENANWVFVNDEWHHNRDLFFKGK